MNNLKQMLKGIILGGGMILPGVSGGVLAVILGLYEKILDAVSNLFKDFKKNFLFLLPLVIGVIIGVIIFGKLLLFLFNNYPSEAKFTFIGLILGGIPVLYKQLLSKGQKKLNLPAFIIALSISLLLFVFGKKTFNIDFSSSLDDGIIGIVLLFFSGFIYVSGKIIPGISSSFMLMLIGMYQFLLKTLSNPIGLSKSEYLQLIPFVIGMLVGVVILVKFIRYLLKKHFTLTYSIIIGFVIGSIAAIYPGLSFNLSGVICLILLLISLFVSYKFSLMDHD